MIIKGTDLKKLPDDEIYNLYVNNNFSLKKLARRYDVDKGTIKSRLKRRGITNFKRIINKTCKKCGKIITTKNYVKIYCFECRKERDKLSHLKYEKNNPEKLRESRRLYKKNNKDKVFKAGKEYSRKNKDKLNKKARERYDPIKRHEKYLKCKDKYRNKLIETKRHYYRKRRKNDATFRIIERIASLIRQALKLYTNTGKTMSSKGYGINYQEIVNHLKPFPEDFLENPSKWHIDHIRPLASFNFINEDGSTNLEEIKKACDKTNLQWLLAKDNISKGSLYNGVRYTNLNKNSKTINL